MSRFDLPKHLRDIATLDEYLFTLYIQMRDLERRSKQSPTKQERRDYKRNVRVYERVINLAATEREKMTKQFDEAVRRANKKKNETNLPRQLECLLIQRMIREYLKKHTHSTTENALYEIADRIGKTFEATKALYYYVPKTELGSEL
jgi:hypothetical protein